jgi:tripeptidyl-peptidase-1
LFASGDNGVAGRRDGNNPAARGCMGSQGTVFNPGWPNTCPYITNVAATKVMPDNQVTDPEWAVFDPKDHPYSDDFSSGGGFSNIYPIPEYQSQAVERYLDKYSPGYKSYSRPADAIGANGGVFNRLGRAYPDVAANGDNILMYNRGKLGTGGGTSASAPIFGAIINRINEERLARQKVPVGFINPVLYSHPEILNDIVNGSNPGCGTGGFTAVPGWDPTSGLGTPNYPKMLEFFLSLP